MLLLLYPTLFSSWLCPCFLRELAHFKTHLLMELMTGTRTCAVIPGCVLRKTRKEFHVAFGIWGTFLLGTTG